VSRKRLRWKPIGIDPSQVQPVHFVPNPELRLGPSLHPLELAPTLFEPVARVGQEAQLAGVSLVRTNPAKLVHGRPVR
ncbi:MAG TPA: hypothetical protein VGH07_02085, partial [Chthoniobacterales bacterium]